MAIAVVTEEMKKLLNRLIQYGTRENTSLYCSKVGSWGNSRTSLVSISGLGLNEVLTIQKKGTRMVIPIVNNTT